MRAILFDVYGTLLDVHGVAAAADAMFPGKGAALSVLWRTKQIDYTRLRTLSGRHADFERVTADALEYTFEAMGLAATQAQRSALLAVYERLPAFPDAAPALDALHASGLRLGVLSNGTARMLEVALGAPGLRDRLDPVLSVETVRRFKTAPEAYQLGPDALSLLPGEIGFVSSNAWDIAGAGWFGYRTFWVNRRGEPNERLGVTPAGTGRSLADVVAWVGAAGEWRD